MTSIAISQPRYLPFWQYVQRMNQVDIFVFLDNVQRQSRGYENRNKILVNSVPKWVTIPVKSSTRELISKTTIDGHAWIQDHKNQIKQAYVKHPFFDKVYIEDYYSDCINKLLETHFNYSEVIIKMLLNLSKMLNISPRVINASSLDIPDSKGVDNLFNICEFLGASTYISGTNGRSYGVKEYLTSRGVKVKFHDPEIYYYPQFNNRKEFVPYLSFFDTLFNIGMDSLKSLVGSSLSLADE